MSLLVVLPSSSFFWPKYFDVKIESKNISNFDLKTAKKLRYLPLLQYQLLNEKPFSTGWFKLAYYIAQYDGEMAYNLAVYFNQLNQSQQYLVWLNKAAELKNIMAINTLANIYHADGKYKKAQKLSTLFLNDPTVLKQATLRAIQQGEQGDIQVLHHQVFKTPKLNDFQILLKKYGVNISGTRSRYNESFNCGNSIQFYATSFSDLILLDKLVEEVKTTSLAKFFCFEPIQYIPLKLLYCFNGKRTIQCDENKWPESLKQTPTRYIGFMLPEGGANVYSGIVYIDREDTSQVLLHELTHLLGFVDEYPLRKGHTFCMDGSDTLAINSVKISSEYVGSKKEVRASILKKIPWRNLILSSTPLMTKKENVWLIGTPAEYNNEVGLFKSNTCDNNETKSYKPLSYRTSLEYYEEPLPAIYLKLYQQNKNVYRVPSFNVLFK